MEAECSFNEEGGILQGGLFGQQKLNTENVLNQNMN
jgi:hypothetical protein